MTEANLIAGKLYQAKHSYIKGRPWVISEFVRTIEAHIEKYHGFNMDTLKMGPEQTRNVPKTYLFKTADTKTSFGVTSLSDIRDCTEEAVAEVERLRQAVKDAVRAEADALKALKEFCR